MRNVEGVVIGLVKEIDAAKAQVKLEFPWLQSSYRSNWAPIAAPMSGSKRGLFMMPEKDDEVLVAFRQGNMDHPYVIGFLWNGSDAPPDSKSQNRIIVTSGGHTLRFEDDEKGKPGKRVILKSNAGHEVVLDDEGKNVMVQFKGGGSIKMTQNDLVLQHGHSITITSQGIAIS